MYSGDSILQARSFGVYCDGTVIIRDVSSFLDGLAALFAVYYVFNILYPNTISSTLEFFQR
jgi:hypothetical protein